MPYGNVSVHRLGSKVMIVIDLPDQGEPSIRGHAENLVDPSKWIRDEDTEGVLSLKMTLCRPYRRRGNRRA